jgi:hypothetical protein
LNGEAETAVGWENTVVNLELVTSHYYDDSLAVMMAANFLGNFEIP